MMSMNRKTGQTILTFHRQHFDGFNGGQATCRHVISRSMRRAAAQKNK
jgi:hypothetical protein